MPAGPFYNLIGSTASGTPGTGAFTPNAAASGLISWADSVWGVPTGWIGLVRYDDGSAWELRFGYWNGTTISRPTNGFVASSTGSGLTLTSAAIATLPANAMMVQPHLGASLQRGFLGIPGSTATPSALGLSAASVAGTVGSSTVATTNFRTEQPTSQTTSATTANAQAGYRTPVVSAVNNTSAGRGGWEYVARFGASGLPTGPRLFAGATGTSMVSNTGEPSALVANYAVFGLDSTDSNIQLMTNSNAGGATKIDTGIPLAVNGWYHAQIWMRPGGGRVYALLVRLDTGDIFFTTTTTDIPGTTTLFGEITAGLNGTNTGTAFVLHMGALMLRAGAW